MKTFQMKQDWKEKKKEGSLKTIQKFENVDFLTAL